MREAVKLRPRAVGEPNRGPTCRWLREHRGLTVPAAAARLGVSEADVLALEHGRMTCKLGPYRRALGNPGSKSESHGPPAGARPVPERPYLFVTEDGVVYGRRGRPLKRVAKGHRFYVVTGGASYPVAMAVLETFVGPPPGERTVVFLDGDPANCALSNLAWLPVLDEPEGFEEWRPVVGWEDTHEVSSHGRVVSSYRPDRTLCAFVRRNQHYRDGRSGWVNVVHGGRRRAVSVAALVLEAFVGPRPSDLHEASRINPSGGDWLENLAWQTRADPKLVIHTVRGPQRVRRGGSHA